MDFSLDRVLARLYLSACDRVGAGTRATGRPLIANEGRIEIGRDVMLHSRSAPVRITATTSGTVKIGDRVTIDSGAVIFSESSIRIEDEAVIGPNVMLCDHDETGRAGSLVIESGARIGAGARVIGGCRVAAGTRVPPGTTVRETPTKQAPPATVTNGAAAPSKPVVVAPEVKKRLSVMLLADFTIDEMVEHLAASVRDGIAIDAEVAPFDTVVPTLLGLGQRDPKIDAAVVWTRPDQVSPSFRTLLHGGSASVADVLAEVDAFASVLAASSSAARFVLVASWTLPPWRRGLGMIDLREGGATSLLMRMNLRLADALASTSNVFVLDAQRWLASARDGAFDPKLWHAGKIAFTTDVLAEAAADIAASLRGALGHAKKLVVVDLDDTLWGGIVGDAGWENLRLGGHDAVGEAHVDFQRGLLALTKRGIALAVVSKNEEATALHAMRSHPEMLIRPEALAAYRINWRDKAQNIAEIVEELNLGLQSVVFLDDNPVERARVSEALPEVFVPELPIDPTHYPRLLESLRCFDAPRVTAEDMTRNEMFAAERQRTSAKASVSSMEDWLASLALEVRFEPLDKKNLGRAAQLLNKTNQMNLRTRRLSEAELASWAAEPGHELWTVHVGDRFGDSGLTGLLGLERHGDDLRVADYVLSCRVMGRTVEETMVWAAITRAGALGARRLVASPIPTAKNKPCLDFFSRANLERDGDDYTWPSDRAWPPSVHVKVVGLA